MSWFSSMMHPERGYNDAQEQSNKYYNQAQGYNQPFINNAGDAYTGISGAMNNLLDPQALQDKWSKGYETSDAAKYAQQAASQHGLDAASSMGLMGSSPALQAIQTGTSQIGAADKQKYLDDLMQKYMSGVGIGQGIYGTGANAAGQSSTNAMNQGNNAAELAYGKTNAQGNMFSNLVGGAAGIVGSALGGPIGGAAASWLTKPGVH